jgi:cyclopropane fatty-acyl-phospholipid synthase-like methyltransferase
MPAIGTGEYRIALTESFRWRYAHNQDFWTSDPSLPRIAAMLLDYLEDRPNQNILDIGAGRGRDTRTFLEAGHRVTAIDLHRTSEWDELEDRWGPKLRFINSLVQDWVTSDMFDGAIDNGCFHHQHEEEYPTYLDRVCGVLKPGAHVVFCVFSPSEDDQGRGRFQVMDHGRVGRYFVEAEVRSLFTSHGFTWRASGRFRLPDNSCDNLACVVQTTR